MREGMGLYKAERIDNGEWIQGYLFCIWEKAYILRGTTNGIPNMVEVDPESVCEGTGLVDKKGVKVFEGDEFNIEDEVTGVVIFRDGCFRIEEYGICGTWTESGFDECGGGYGIIECNPIDWYSICDMEVIVNEKAVEE